MTTEGGLGYEALMRMTDQERLWWLQRCLDHNEAMEAKMKGPRR